MRQESNHRMNSGKDNRITISNSRTMGVIILIVLLFAFQVTTFVMHKVRVAPVEKFSFNPNTVSRDSLQLLGFTAKQAQSVINYREKGGKFRKREDFAKLYVVDSAMYRSLAPYILLPDRYVLPAEAEAEKSDVPGTKRAAEDDFVQKKGNPSTKSAGVEASGVRDAGRRSRQETGQQDMQRDLDTLYGRKVVQDRYMCNLNTADSAALVQLYGIGGYYARKILRYREHLGGSYVSPKQLLEIEGFTLERYSKIEKHIFVREEDIRGFSILGADRKTLERHPYIGPYAARGIVTYLRLKGYRTATASGISPADPPSATAESAAAALSQQADIELNLLKELVREKILSQDNARKLEEYLLHL